MSPRFLRRPSVSSEATLPKRDVDSVSGSFYNSRMSRVEIREDESLEKALRRFKRLIEREGILKALKAKKHYEKPSERKRREKRQAMSRRARPPR